MLILLINISSVKEQKRLAKSQINHNESSINPTEKGLGDLLIIQEDFYLVSIKKYKCGLTASLKLVSNFNPLFHMELISVGFMEITYPLMQTQFDVVIKAIRLNTRRLCSTMKPAG